MKSYLATLKKAFELDPHSSILAYQIADSYRGLRNYPEAERYYDLGRSHFESARSLVEARIQDQPEDARIHGSLGIIYAGLGRKKEAIREGRLAVEISEKKDGPWFTLFRIEQLAQIYTMAGEPDRAIDKLEYLLSYPGEYSIPKLRIDPKWNPLREHPRFKKLLEQEK